MRWALTIGINHYHGFQPLNYAQQDAEAIHNYLVQEAEFPGNQCFLLTDTSPGIAGTSTAPTQDQILGWLDRLCERSQPGDEVWVFFSGYGVCHQGQDYLLPLDADPTAIPTTGISLERLFDRLQTSLAKSMLVVLDMSRSEGTFSGEIAGAQTVQVATAAQIPTILSCQPGQFSREVTALKHGLFAAALLESLRALSSPTLEQVDRYLRDRVPELTEHHFLPIQQPLTVSPAERIQQPLFLPPESVQTSPFASLQSFPLTSDPSSDRPLTQTSTSLQAGVPQLPQPISSQPISPQPVSRDPDLVDAPFWRPVVLWSSVGVVALLIGVLWKNWDAITQGTQPVPPTPSPVRLSPTAPPVAVSPNQVRSPLPQSTTTPIPSGTPLPIPSTAATPTPSPKATIAPATVAPATVTPATATNPVLNAAKARAAKGNLPDNYAAAIQQASKIQPNQPQYQEAQQAIAGWSQEILIVAKQQAKQNRFDAAIFSGALVPVQNPTVFQETRALLPQWCRSLTIQTSSTPPTLAQQQARIYCRDKLGLR
jgi:hypothetical protein